MKEIKILSEFEKQAMFKLCKVWGFVKYYHPQVASGVLDWDEELFKIMAKLFSLKDSKEIDEVIYEWINSLEEVEEDTREEEKREVKLEPDTEWIKDTSFINEKLSELLIKIEKCKRPETNYYFTIVKDVGNTSFPNEKKYEYMDYGDLRYKLLSLFRYWNVIQYLYPYRDLMDESLDSVLKEFIPKLVQCNDELSYKLTLYELIGKIGDGHSWIYILQTDKTLINFWGVNVTPISVREVENKIAVTRKFKELDKDSNIEIGDVILKVNGKAIFELIKEKEKYVEPSSKNYHRFWLWLFLLRTNDEYMDFLIERDGKIIESRIKSVEDSDIFESIILAEEHRKPYEFLKEDIGYLCPSTLVEEEMDGIIETFKNTKGIIVDARYYPSGGAIWDFVNYVIPETQVIAKFSKLNGNKPGEFVFEEDSENNTVEGNKDYYKGKVVTIINEESLSQPELLAMSLKVAPNGVVVGTSSAGADGNCSFLILPGNVKTSFSGIGVYYPNGGETQRIGIIPDIEARQTVEGIRKGRDELIEKAIEVIYD